MLTAIREMAEEAGAGGDARRAIVARGDDCVARTQEMLPVLTEAGVVDAGAAGLVEIVRGIAAVLAGEPLPGARRLDGDASRTRRSTRSSRATATAPSSSSRATALDADALEAELEPLGDSLLVVGDPTRAQGARPHRRPRPRALARRRARDDRAASRSRTCTSRRASARSGCCTPCPTSRRTRAAAVAVAGGAGNRAAVREPRRARRRRRPHDEPVDGRPPRRDRGVARRRGGRAPEQPERDHGAEQAAEHASKTVRVVPTRSLQAGLAAMVAFDPARARGRERRRDARPRSTASPRARSRSPRATWRRTASRSARARGSGSPTGEPVAGGEPFDEVARAVLERLLAEPRGVLTLLTGEEPPALDGLLAELEARHPGARARGARRRPAALPAAALGRVAARVSSGRGRRSASSLVEDNQIFRETLELLLGLRADIEVVASRRDRRRGGRGRARTLAPGRRADGLPHAGAERRAGDRGGARGGARTSRVVCLTASVSHEREVEQLLAAGAVACVTKDDGARGDRRRDPRRGRPAPRA